MGLWFRLCYLYLCLLAFLGWKKSGFAAAKYEEVSTLDDFKILTLDDRGYRIDDHSSYHEEDGEYVYGYRLRPRSRCVEVRYKDLTLWNHSSAYHLPFPYRLVLNFYSKTLLVDQIDKWSYHFTAPNPSLGKGSSHGRVSPLDINVITSDGSSFRENDESGYTKKVAGYVIGYKFEKNVKCVEVRHRDRTIWKFNANECADEHPETIFINTHSRMLMVDLTNDWSYFSKHSRFDMGMNQALNVPPNAHHPNHNSDEVPDALEELHKSQITIVTFCASDGQGLAENLKSRYSVKRYRYVHEYKFKKDVLCSEIRVKGATVWRYNELECQHKLPRVIYLNSYAKMILVDIERNWSYFYKYDRPQVQPPWSMEYSHVPPMAPFHQPSSSTASEQSSPSGPMPASPAPYAPGYAPTPGQAPESTPRSAPLEQPLIQPRVDYKDMPILLDIEEKRTTDKFFFYHDEKTKTGIYIARPGFLFNKVAQRGYHTFRYCYLWHTFNHNRLSNMVIVNGIDKKEAHVTIYSFDGNRTHYETRYESSVINESKAMEVRSYVQHKDCPEALKIITIRSDGHGPSQDAQTYDVLLNKVYLSDKPDHSIFHSFEYRFKDSARCSELKFNEEVVWSFNYDPQRGFPKVVHYHPELGLIIVEFDLHTFTIYKNKGKAWALFNPTTESSQPYDVEGNYEFRRVDESQGKIRECRRKIGSFFNSVKGAVKRSPTLDGYKDYANKVMEKVPSYEQCKEYGEQGLKYVGEQCKKYGEQGLNYVGEQCKTYGEKGMDYLGEQCKKYGEKGLEVGGKLCEKGLEAGGKLCEKGLEAAGEICAKCGKKLIDHVPGAETCVKYAKKGLKLFPTSSCIKLARKGLDFVERKNKELMEENV